MRQEWPSPSHVSARLCQRSPPVLALGECDQLLDRMTLIDLTCLLGRGLQARVRSFCFSNCSGHRHIAGVNG